MPALLPYLPAVQQILRSKMLSGYGEHFQMNIFVKTADGKSCITLLFLYSALHTTKAGSKQAVGTQLSKVSGEMADGPSQFWNPYDLSKSGDELWATLPDINSLKNFD